MAKHIVFRGAGFSNKGAEAMLLTAQRELAARLGSVRVSAILPYSQSDLAVAARVTPIAFNGTRNQKIWHLLSRSVEDHSVRRATFANVLAAFEIAITPCFDAMIDISGFAYSDQWGKEAAARGSTWARYCSESNRPFICMPQAWGPFNEPTVARNVRMLCKHASLIYARDRTSIDYLLSLDRGVYGRVAMAPDIAFRFASAVPGDGERILTNAGVTLGARPLVALTPNYRVYERMPGIGKKNEYVRFMIRVAEHCSNVWKATPILIPHEFRTNGQVQGDDRELCELVHAATARSGHCIYLSSYHSADQVKAIISHMDLVVGSRFHSLVFALASGIPVVAFAWTHKYSQLLDLVGLKQFAIDFSEVTDHACFDLIDAAWHRREENATLVRQKVQDCRRAIDELFDDVVDVIAPTNVVGRSSLNVATRTDS